MGVAGAGGAKPTFKAAFEFIREDAKLNPMMARESQHSQRPATTTLVLERSSLKFKIKN